MYLRLGALAVLALSIVGSAAAQDAEAGAKKAAEVCAAANDGSASDETAAIATAHA